MVFFWKKKQPYTKNLSIAPPAASPDRHGVAVVACVRNEGDYIAEWLTYHSKVGVRKFYLYIDSCSDNTRDEIERVSSDVDVVTIPWSGRIVDTSSNHILNSQAIAFAHSILNFGSQFRWMAFIDVDEFLLPKKSSNVEEALESIKDFPNVSLPWHMFGKSGHKTKPSGGVLRNYTQRARIPLSDMKNVRNFKCIVDPCSVNEVSIHHFSTVNFGEMTCNDAGFVTNRKGRKQASFYSSVNLQLNHYYSKSDEELRRKLSRGPASPASRERYENRVLSAVSNIEADLIEDRSMLEFLDSLGWS